MTTRYLIAVGVLLSALHLDVAKAADLVGAWANDVSVCPKLFVKTGDRISFTKDADAVGSGFIVEGNRIRGKFASCTIKISKQSGPTLNLVTVCSTDVAVDTVQFTLKFIDDNKISREFPGIPEMDVTYARCPF